MRIFLCRIGIRPVRLLFMIPACHTQIPKERAGNALFTPDPFGFCPCRL